LRLLRGCLSVVCLVHHSEVLRAVREVAIGEVEHDVAGRWSRRRCRCRWLSAAGVGRGRRQLVRQCRVSARRRGQRRWRGRRRSLGWGRRGILVPGVTNPAGWAGCGGRNRVPGGRVVWRDRGRDCRSRWVMGWSRGWWMGGGGKNPNNSLTQEIVTVRGNSARDGHGPRQLNICRILAAKGHNQPN
jgi:hypothetical protein